MVYLNANPNSLGSGDVNLDRPFSSWNYEKAPSAKTFQQLCSLKRGYSDSI